MRSQEHENRTTIEEGCPGTQLVEAIYENEKGEREVESSSLLYRAYSLVGKEAQVNGGTVTHWPMTTSNINYKSLFYLVLA